MFVCSISIINTNSRILIWFKFILWTHWDVSLNFMSHWFQSVMSSRSHMWNIGYSLCMSLFSKSNWSLFSLSPLIFSTATPSWIHFWSSGGISTYIEISVTNFILFNFKILKLVLDFCLTWLCVGSCRHGRRNRTAFRAETFFRWRHREYNC